MVVGAHDTGAASARRSAHGCSVAANGGTGCSRFVLTLQVPIHSVPMKSPLMGRRAARIPRCAHTAIRRDPSRPPSAIGALPHLCPGVADGACAPTQPPSLLIAEKANLA